MPSAPVDRDTTFTLYCNLMAEIKTRNKNAGILLATLRKPIYEGHAIDPEFVAEYCYLQLRKMCELIALACLAAHGDIEKTRSGRLQGQWNAHFIIKALSQLNPDFYPVPAIFGPRPATLDGSPAMWTPMTEPYLTKEELLGLYNNECGELMHLGSLEDLLARRKIEVHQDRMVEWFVKIARLLTNHRILLYGSNEEIWVDLSLPGSEVEARLVMRHDQ